MADTVVFQSTTPSTPPDATIVATDDAGAAGQVQIVKLAISANGDATPTPASVADGLLVNLGANNDVTVTGTVAVTGGATSAKQDTGNASLASIDGKITAVNTGAVVVASSALPAGASTSAKQDTQTTELTSIKTAVEIIDNAISGTEMQVDVITSALPTGASTAALQTQPGVDIGDVTVNNAAGAAAINIQDGGNSITVDGTVTASIAGVATEATLATRLSESDFDTKIGSLTETAPATDTASSGLNGRLQRIAQRLTSIIALLVQFVTGGGTEAAALRVTVASDSTGLLSVDDNGASITVDGTVTANLAAGTNNIGDVDVLSLPALPAGTNNIGDIDVLSLPALPAGTNNIGDVDVASISAGDNNIGNVDVVTMPVVAVTQSGTWDEVGINDSGNSITVDAPVGTPAFVRLSDGSAAITTLPVSLASVPSHAVTNAGTFVTQENGALLTAAQLLDDAVITDDTTTFTPTTSKGLAIAGAVDDDSTDAADEGDMVILRATKERKLRVVAALDSAAMQSGNDQVTPKFVAIAASSSGDNTVVAGVGSKKLRVLSYVLMASGTVNAKFQSSTGGDISGLLYMVANTGASSGFSPVGHFETVAGEDLQLNLSAAIAVGGHLTYIEVD